MEHRPVESVASEQEAAAAGVPSPGGAEPARPGEAAAGASRFASLDALRVVGAIAILWLHANSGVIDRPRWTAPTRFAVPFFAASIALFAARAGAAGRWGGWASYSGRRALRLYVPYLLWTAIYAVGGFALGVLVTYAKTRRVPTSIQWTWAWDWSRLAGSGEYHLWFMPFALVVSVLAFAVGAAAGRRRAGASAAWAGLLVVAGAGACVQLARPFVPPGFPSIEYVLRLSLEATPAALWGIALGLAGARAGEALRRPSVTGLAVLAWAVATAALVAGDRQVGLENLAGVAALLVGFRRASGAPSRWLAQWSWLAFGFYLAHALVLATVRPLFTTLGLGQGVGATAVVVAIAAAGTVLVCLGLRRAGRVGKWLIP